MRNKARRLWGMKTDGFTIIEMLVAMALVGIVMGAIYGVFASSNRSYHTQDSVADAQQNVRAGIDFMVRDLRMAGLDPLDKAGAGIETAAGSNLRFTADLDMDGIIDNPDASDGIDEADLERVAYEYDGANLLERVLYKADGTEEDRQTLVDNVSALQFTYPDAASVVISMTVRGTDAHGQIFTRTLNTRVSCRNLNAG